VGRAQVKAGNRFVDSSETPNTTRSWRLAERAAEEAFDALGKDGGAGEALPALQDATVGGDEECGGELADLELTGELTIVVEQHRDFKVPVVAGI